LQKTSSAWAPSLALPTTTSTHTSGHSSGNILYFLNQPLRTAYELGPSAYLVVYSKLYSPSCRLSRLEPNLDLRPPSFQLVEPYSQARIQQHSFIASSPLVAVIRLNAHARSSVYSPGRGHLAAFPCPLCLPSALKVPLTLRFSSSASGDAYVLIWACACDSPLPRNNKLLLPHSGPDGCDIVA